MKISKTLIAAFGMASLAACGGTTDDNAANMDANLDANMMVDDNMGMPVDANMTTDANMGVDAMNGTDGMNTTANAMANDMNTTNPDANLANGM